MYLDKCLFILNPLLAAGTAYVPVEKTSLIAALEQQLYQWFSSPFSTKIYPFSTYFSTEEVGKEFLQESAVRKGEFFLLNRRSQRVLIQM